MNDVKRKRMEDMGKAISPKPATDWTVITVFLVFASLVGGLLGYFFLK
ncbi:MAG: hypothetical protein ACRC6V_09430 [Bacteroidales bacterium]